MAARLIPGTPAPTLRFATVAHGAYDVAQDAPAGGTYLVFHRGSHCKWSRLMLKELDDRIGDFALRGVRVVAVSSEDETATRALAERMQIIRLPLGFGLETEPVADDWGLYLTANSTEPDAPALHWEPAQAWLRHDGQIGLISVQTGPSLWPDATSALRAIDNTMTKFPELGAAQLATVT